MFRKILIFAMFATAAGYCFAAPQIVTSEVVYDGFDGFTEEVETTRTTTTTTNTYGADDLNAQYADVPAWPLAGTDADVSIACRDGACGGNKSADNIRIVSKIGADLVVENNFNLATRNGDFGGWSGGANLLHGTQIPVGFDDECNRGSEMPLLHREVLEDDGGDVLTVSRSGRKNCNNYSDSYTAYMARMGMTEKLEEKEAASDDEIAVDISADAEAPATMQDQVRSWVVARGQTMRQVLQSWADKEGWDLVWATSREYPIEASAVFKGRFVDVASALVRNFGRATPVPYAKFYKGNRVLVITSNDQ